MTIDDIPNDNDDETPMIVKAERMMDRQQREALAWGREHNSEQMGAAA